MNESIVTFGRNHNLCGIVNRKQHSRLHSPAIIILNSGLINKPGPFGLNTRLARKIAEQGFIVLRFDLSGIGDSPKHADNRDRHQQIIGDVKDAMDMLQSNYGVQTFIAMGICAGADNTHRIMSEDERLSGAIFLDGYAYPTLKYQLIKHRYHALNPLYWLKAGLAPFLNIPKLFHQQQTTQQASQANLFWSLPPKRQFQSDLIHAVEHNVQLLYIFSGGEQLCLYKNQFQDSFPDINFGDQLQVDIMPDAHHLFVTEEEREELTHKIICWLQQKFNPPQ